LLISPEGKILCRITGNGKAVLEKYLCKSN
jgi:hypothetical protein